MDSLVTNIIGYLATICMVFGYLPQAIATIRTRKTDGIAMPTFIMLGLGSIFFVLQGLLLRNWPLVIANVITTICSVIIFVIKLINDSKK
jgi:MtN3 and saliva related transmembrane protein